MKKPVLWLLIAFAGALMAFGCLMVIKEAPRFVTAKISGVLITKDWRSDPGDRLRISGNDLTCQPDDGQQWACAVMLEGKPLAMTVTYRTTPFQSLTGCTVVYDGQSRPCEVYPGYDRDAQLLVSDDLGISPARMAELRARNPLLYWTEATWLSVGIIVAVLWAGLIMAALLLALNTTPHLSMSIGRIRLPIWAVCGVVILAAVTGMGMLGAGLVLPLAALGGLILPAVIVGLNRLDKKRGVAFARPLMWAAASLVVFSLVNLGTVLGLLTLGFVD